MADLARIGSNIQALSTLNSLRLVQNRLQLSQTRLATGRRINSAEDDPAGLTIGNKFGARLASMAQAMSNIADAKSMGAVAEGGFAGVQDLLSQIRAKAVQASNDTIGAEERSAIESQIVSFLDQIDAQTTKTTWNGNALFTTAAFSFHVGADSNDNLSLTFANGMTSADLGIDTVGISGGDAADAEAFIGSIDLAIGLVSANQSNLGATLARLTAQEDSLAVAKVNTESAWNRIWNADMAEEQVNASKYAIMQQTSIAMLTQANSAPQAILSLFR
jgi:flagellin